MRRELDKYRTPSWMTEAFKESFPDVRGDILIDPCAGDCRMAAALASRFGWAVTNDIDLDEPTNEHFDATLPAFWDDPDCIRKMYDLPEVRIWVVSNPPFKQALPIIQRALMFTPNVAMLLRSTWLEPTKEHAELLKTCPPSRMLYLPRGSFTGGGSDSVSCAWFVWGGDVGSTPPIRVWSGIEHGNHRSAAGFAPRTVNAAHPLPAPATSAGGAQVTRLEQAALRLYAATKADRERSLQMARLVCEREGEVKDYDRPCWKPWHNPGHIEDGPEACWEYPSGEYGEHPSSWCEPCQKRQKIYEDKSVRKELGKAKIVFWAACRAAAKEARK